MKVKLKYTRVPYDKWSKMHGKELVSEVKKITMACNNGKGLSIPQNWKFADEWTERQMREFLRFLYANLKETYIAKIEIMDSLAKEQNEDNNDEK